MFLFILYLKIQIHENLFSCSGSNNLGYVIGKIIYIYQEGGGGDAPSYCEIIYLSMKHKVVHNKECRIKHVHDFFTSYFHPRYTVARENDPLGVLRVRENSF